MVNIAPSSGSPFVESRECFDFVIDSLRYMNLYGASFNGSLMRNEVFVYTKSQPTIANYSDPATQAGIIQFYELLDLKWGKIKYCRKNQLSIYLSFLFRKSW